MAFKFRAGES